ncbi:MAG: TonB-dependent receptor [Sphingobium sp.]|uniref:TonB-dependent receptor domain-containing protein n=1 Tax=Sphingobium sp. TaxID=1912891 RepID=UPI000DB0FF2C|nr:MAG: TonB-dependent receptor [Sphingobium sp.]
MIRSSLTAALSIVALSGGAMATTQRPFAVPPSSLDVAIVTLGRQAGVDIVSTERDLPTIRVRGVRGVMDVENALALLLRGTGLQGRRLDARSFRVERRSMAALQPPREIPPLPVAAQPVPTPLNIVVTAAKRPSSLLRFPAGVTLVTPGLTETGVGGDRSSFNEMTDRLPVMQQTALGPGRNKLFIRGIADSSFNGPTQSTVSVYFGDVQLGYNGPDPDLRLHDVERVEILEGPQGTLYGAGAIGGIIRIVPNAVNVTDNEAVFSLKTSMTHGGGPGHDVAGAFNLALPAHEAGLRAVVYDAVDGGYIDDPLTGVNDINRSHVRGGRLTGRLLSDDGWDVELGGLYQRIDNRDGQYVQSAAGFAGIEALGPEPSESDFSQFRVVLNKMWDSGLRLVSASGFVARHSSELFDASRLAGGPDPTFYWSYRRNHSVSQELRLYRSRDLGLSWLVGAALLDSRERNTREFGRDGAAQDIVGVLNRTRSVALFSELSWAFSPRLSVTGGGRLTAARTDSDPLDGLAASRYVHGIETTRLDPTLALSWLAAPDLSVYGRFQTGFRTGGLAVARGGGRVATFKPDAISVLEAGVRSLPTDPRLPRLNLGISYARWKDIQADLIDRSGFPYTATIGRARIWSVEAGANWSPTPRWDLGGSLLYSYNRISGAWRTSRRAKSVVWQKRRRWPCPGGCVTACRLGATDGPSERKPLMLVDRFWGPANISTWCRATMPWSTAA